jgi:uncharacterized protein YeaO (DUF488 family)
MPEVRVRRVYEAPLPSDGTRVLVDRLWPRGLAREAARIDEWLKTVAPSDALRRWYGHDPARFAEFRRRYTGELAEPERAAALRHLRELARSGPLTLLSATRDLDHSQAADLAERLTRECAGAAGDDRPGDSPCWLSRVCPRCGSIADAEPPTTCPRCHAPVPGD